MLYKFGDDPSLFIPPKWVITSLNFSIYKINEKNKKKMKKKNQKKMKM